MIYPVILCGGTGTRLWPLSRFSFPKQFSSFVGEKTLFQSCYQRALNKEFGVPIVITNEEYRFIVGQQINELTQSKPHILLEPFSKNTAPAILVVSEYLKRLNPNSLMLVMPSDHLIKDDLKFRKMISDAASNITESQIGIFGVSPNRPETGYGYIEVTKDKKVESFHEKPSHEAANIMFQNEKFYWNSGVFLASPNTIIETSKKFVPKLCEQAEQACDELKSDLDFIRIPNQIWSNVNSISFDKAVIEKTNNLSFFSFASDWSDLGSWQSVLETSNKDQQGNFTQGKVVHSSVSNSLLMADEGAPLLSVFGLKNIIAVSTADAVLVTDIVHDQKIGFFLKKIKDHGFKEAENHKISYRPWGWFESLLLDENYQVKRLTVSPFCAISLQRHKFRSEHWIVTSGTATIQIEEKDYYLEENQSIYIKSGAKHRLTNDSAQELVVIEVQTGSYLGEDDIERFDDLYKRI